jgi:tetratricopeptide (TPR) repeat protein
MNRFFLFPLIAIFISAAPLFADECSVSDYEKLVAEGKSGDSSREWGKSVEAYNRILSECLTRVVGADLVKVYDALSAAQLMQESYSAAIESAKKCIDLDTKYNACMMTAARSYDNLGDREKALEFARSAAETDVYDEYSSAVAILAKDFLRRLEKK